MTRERARRANHWFTSPAPFAKIFRFTFDPNHFYIVRIPAQHRGAFRDRHERKVGMRWTRVARLTRALTCGWRSRVVLTPRRWRQVGESNFTNDGGKQARSPRRARRKPLKPSRAGMPGDPGATVVTNARAIYSTRAAAGATGTRHSPLPQRGAKFKHHSGATRRGNAKAHRFEVIPDSIFFRHSPMRNCASEDAPSWRRPGIHNPCGGYGFRARSLRSRPE
jgi:hypothetical protein